jgi:hypothetical protein
MSQAELNASGRHEPGRRLTFRTGAVCPADRSGRPGRRGRQAGVDDAEDGRLGRAVEDVEPLAAVLYQAGFTQRHQVLGDVRLAETQDRLKMADTLLAVTELAQNGEPGRMTQEFEKMSGRGVLIHIQKSEYQGKGRRGDMHLPEVIGPA